VIIYNVYVVKDRLITQQQRNVIITAIKLVLNVIMEFVFVIMA